MGSETSRVCGSLAGPNESGSQEEHEAARRIQAAFRGHTDRKLLKAGVSPIKVARRLSTARDAEQPAHGNLGKLAHRSPQKTGLQGDASALPPLPEMPVAKQLTSDLSSASVDARQPQPHTPVLPQKGDKLNRHLTFGATVVAGSSSGPGLQRASTMPIKPRNSLQGGFNELADQKFVRKLTRSDTLKRGDASKMRAQANQPVVTQRSSMSLPPVPSMDDMVVDEDEEQFPPSPPAGVGAEERVSQYSNPAVRRQSISREISQRAARALVVFNKLSKDVDFSADNDANDDDLPARYTRVMMAAAVIVGDINVARGSVDYEPTAQAVEFLAHALPSEAVLDAKPFVQELVETAFRVSADEFVQGVDVVTVAEQVDKVLDLTVLDALTSTAKFAELVKNSKDEDAAFIHVVDNMYKMHTLAQGPAVDDVDDADVVHPLHIDAPIAEDADEKSQDSD